MMDFNNFYDRICSYIILPFRFVVFSGSMISLSVGLYLNAKLGLNYSKNIFNSAFNFIPWGLGLNINIEKDKNYDLFMKDRLNYILIYNHVSFYDAFLLQILYCKKISALIVEYAYNIPILHTIFKSCEMIPVERGKKSNSIEKIRNYVENKGSICIAPDGCHVFDEQKMNIAPFKNGAFIPKKDIYPVLFRYVPSYTKNVNWGENDTFIKAFMNNFQDGNIDIFMKVLPKQYYKDEYKSHEDYRDYVYNLMNDELSRLPSQYPPRLLKRKDKTFAENAILYLLFILSCIDNSYIKIFMINYISYSYKTKNTLNLAILINILTAYSCFFIS